MVNKSVKRDILFREIKTTSNKNVLELEGKIEIKKVGNRWITKPVFFLTIFENMERKNTDKQITMQLSPLGLLSTREGLVELIEEDKELMISNMELFSGGTSNTKKLQVVKDASHYFLNFFSGSKKISLALTYYEAKGFIEILHKSVEKLYDTDDNYREKIQEAKKEKGKKEDG